MKQVPFDIGMVHFIGIGGIGMSGIAEVMHNLGYQVQGSDMQANPNVIRLQGLGVTVFVGQQASNIKDADVVVISTAIKEDNPELQAARAAGLPIVRRAEMLAELMRLKWTVSVAGTHGKTTTTSMVATVLEAAQVDPTVINGGIINAYGTNARRGEGDWMVVEADESDGTFVKLPATIAVVTNMDPEHLDFYGTFEAEREAFKAFLDKVPFYGAAVMCIDHPEVQRLIPEISNRRVISYGTSPQAAVRGVDLTPEKGGITFGVDISETKDQPAKTIDNIHLPMPGLHNVQNALAAIAVGLEMGIDSDVLRRAFAGFKGVKRRFTHTGTGAGVHVVDDYGHHPVEIKSVLAAARESFDGKIIAVVQPHRYSRLESLFDDFCTCFNDADTVIVTPVYEAGEQPIAGAEHEDLVNGLRASGHKSVDQCAGGDDLAEVVSRYAAAGDAVICLGAGTITKWAHDLPAQLEEMEA